MFPGLPHLKTPQSQHPDKEGKGADLIIECLTAGGTLEGGPAAMDVPEGSVAPIPPMEPTIAMLISTSMGKDQRMGAACVLTVTSSMEIMNLETPQWQLAVRGLQ